MKTKVQKTLKVDYQYYLLVKRSLKSSKHKKYTLWQRERE